MRAAGRLRGPSSSLGYASPKYHMKYFTIYRITNNINNKIYIGMHETCNLNDSYLGSGKLLKAAISKYGKDNFRKEILFVFSSREEMVAKERELVTEEFLGSKLSYNLTIGGSGGGYFIRNHPNYQHWQQKGSKAGAEWSKANNGGQNLELFEKRSARMKARMTVEAKEYLSKKVKEHRAKHPREFFMHSEESKTKISESNKGKGSGSKNSQFGSFWITNGIDNAKIIDETSIPNGWYRGRTLKRISS